MSRASVWVRMSMLVALGAGSAAGQDTTRVSVDSGGVQGNGDSGGSLASLRSASISADGRFVAFESLASNLVAGDTNQTRDVFVHDRQSGTTERVSVDSAGAQGSGSSSGPSISADGRYVAFHSNSSTLVAGDTNGYEDVFVRDRQNGTTERVSVDSGGAQANSDSAWCSISADGRCVVFISAASNLVAGDTNTWYDVFVHDRQSGTTERVSVASTGAQANDNCQSCSISADGRFVAIASIASNLVAGDTNGISDIFVHDRTTGTTERVSVATGGAEANAHCADPSISADGRWVAFFSYASNLVAGDTNGVADVFVHDRQGATTELASVATGGGQGNGDCFAASVSADGRCVAFESGSSDLVAGDTNGLPDVFLRDRQSATTERVSVATSGTEANGVSGFTAISLSADGRFVAFDSLASNLAAGDTNGRRDVFVRDRGANTPGTDLCQPGAGGVIACPCSNPPANAPRGCDNSSATGGAQLTSSGMASLAADTVVFVTNGEEPTAMSVVLQGNAEIPGGIAFGQGVRCAGGGLKRLYVKTASGGSITAPEPGDASVSARSAALGDPITAGMSRWYAVYYRDPLVLGGCTATSTFNSTQTQQVDWLP